MTTTKHKRLKDEPWPDYAKFRVVSRSGRAGAWTGNHAPTPGTHEWYSNGPGEWFGIGEGYDATDWQNSLERRPK